MTLVFVNTFFPVCSTRHRRQAVKMAPITQAAFFVSLLLFFFGFFFLPLSLVNVNTEDFRLQVFLPSGVGATTVVKFQKSADNVPWRSTGSVSLRRRPRQRCEDVAVLDYVRQRDLNVRRQHLVPATRCLHAPSGPHSSSTRSSSVSS